MPIPDITSGRLGRSARRWYCSLIALLLTATTLVGIATLAAASSAQAPASAGASLTSALRTPRITAPVATTQVTPHALNTVEMVPSSYNGSAIPDTCPATVDVTQPLYDWINTLPQGTSSNPTEVLFAKDGCYLINGMIFLRGLQDFIFDGNGSTFTQTSIQSAELGYGDVPPTEAPYCETGADSGRYGTAQNAKEALDTILSQKIDIMWFVEGGCDLEFENMDIVGADSAETTAKSSEQDSAIQISGAQRVLIANNTITSAYGDFVTVTGLHEGLDGGFFNPSADVTIADNTFKGAGRNGVSVVYANRVTIGGPSSSDANSIREVGDSAIDIETDIPGNPSGGEANILVANNTINNYAYLLSAVTFGQLADFGFENNTTGPVKIQLQDKGLPGQNITIAGNTTSTFNDWPHPYDMVMTDEIGGLVSKNTAPMCPGPVCPTGSHSVPDFVTSGTGAGTIAVQDNTLNGTVASVYPLQAVSTSGDTECDNLTPTGASLDAKSASLESCPGVPSAQLPITPVVACQPQFISACATGNATGNATDNTAGNAPVLGLRHERVVRGRGRAKARAKASSGGPQAGTINCTLSGSVSFDPPLTDGGTSTAEMALVHVTANDCTGVGGAHAPKVGNGTMVLPLTTTSCGNLQVASTTPTSLALSWTPASLGVSEVIFPGVTPITTPEPGFSLGGTGTVVRGSYPGTHDGGLSTATLTLGLTASEISADCASTTGFTAAPNATGTETVGGSGGGGGPSWSSPVSIDPGNDLTSVSCPSASFCAAVDHAGNALTYNGSNWSAPVTIDSAPLYTVSCASTSFCVAGDDDGNVFTYNGSNWSAPDNIDPSNAVESVSCPSASFCAGVDNVGNALTYNGSSWSAPTSLPTGFEFVSCASAMFCDAVGIVNGDMFTYNGGSWSGPTATVGGIVEVSCPSASFCAAPAGGQDVIYYNGTSWSAPTSVDGINELWAVSCSSASFCAGVGQNVLTYNGASWSAPTTVDGSGFLGAVSCPSASFCAAVDENGNVVTYSG